MLLVQLAIYIIVAAVVFGIAYIVVKQSGIPIPPWVMSIIGLVVLAVVAILAVRFVASL